MTMTEKALYHQIHPAKLATDISASLVSTFLLWEQWLWVAILVAFIPSMLASALVIRFANLQKLKDSNFGRYIEGFMTHWIEAWRVAGQLVAWFGAWTHQFWLIPSGILITLMAWVVGMWGG